jgi:hypothetical protein
MPDIPQPPDPAVIAPQTQQSASETVSTNQLNRDAKPCVATYEVPLPKNTYYAPDGVLPPDTAALLRSYIAAIVRWLLTLVGAYLAKRGYDAATAKGLIALVDPTAVSGAIMTLGSIGWSLYHKRDTHSKLVAATK